LSAAVSAPAQLVRADAAAAIDSNLFVAMATGPLAAVSAPSGHPDTDSSPVVSAAPFAQAQFVALVAGQLVSHFNLEGELQLELLRSWTPPARVAKSWQVEITEFPTVTATSMLVRCRILAEGVAISEPTLVVHAALWRDAWVAREPLTVGATFDPAVLDTRRTDLLRDRDALPAAVGDRNFIISRSVQAGRLMTWRDIGRRPLVRKGQLVEVSAADGQLSLTMKALAMQNGSEGEAVTVRNVDSKKDFTAFVIDENRVQVRF
jgi:flagella basal body P-ring formation protein FlgA